MTQAPTLREAVHAALLADPMLVAALGGARIHAEAAESLAPPYVMLGAMTPRDDGAAHELVLQAWSRGGGHAEAHAIAGALLQALDEAPLGALGAASRRQAVADIRRGRDGITYHTVVRFCAISSSRL